VSPVEVISTLGPEVEVISAVGPDVVATTTVLPPQAIANVLLSGPPGPVGPAGSLAGYFTPQQFGAVGDGVHDDTAAVQAAIAAAGTANVVGRGGVVYYPPGTYNCSAALTYWPCTMWVGAGAAASIIKLTTDLWNGSSPTAARFIVPGAGVSQLRNFKMADLRIIGPGPGASSGVVPSHTNGVRSASGVIFDNVYIGGGFFAGLEITADHEKMLNLYSTGNYYNLEYSDALVTAANQTFFSCILNGCGLASIHVSGASRIDATTFNQLHLGFGPVGIVMTDKQNGWDASGNPVYAGGGFQSSHRIISTTFNDVIFEQVGNVAILDMCSTSGPANYSLHSSVIRGEGVIWAPAGGQYTTTNAPLNLPDYQGAWAMILRSSYNSRIEAGLNPFTAPPSTGLGVLKLMAVNNMAPSFVFGAAPPTNFYGSGTSWTAVGGGKVRHAMANPAGGGMLTAGGAYGDAVQMDSTTLINVGDLVEQAATNARVQRATGTKPIFGVAMTPTPASASALVVQTNGYCPVNSTVTGVAPGSILYLDATTPYMINNTNTAGRVAGVAMSTLGSGVIYTQLRFGAA
jgi:hypothetical protein